MTPSREEIDIAITHLKEIDAVAHSPSLRVVLEALIAAEEQAAEYRHKASQYDTIVHAVGATDGGRYRADVLSAILRIKRERTAAEEKLERYEEALKRIEHDGFALESGIASEALRNEPVNGEEVGGE